MRRWALLASVLLMQVPAANALNVTYVTVSEVIKTESVCARAGGNGSGPCDAASATGSGLTFVQQRSVNPSDIDTDLGAFAAATASISQATFLSAAGVSSSGSATTGAQVFIAGEGRAGASSELKTAFFVDADTSFTLYGFVNCAGLCTAFVSLFDPENIALFDLAVTDGERDKSLTGTLRANQTYFLWASAESTASVPPSTVQNSAGDFTVVLDLSGGAGLPVPEPGTYALMLAGLLVLVTVRRR